MNHEKSDPWHEHAASGSTRQIDGVISPYRANHSNVGNEVVDDIDSSSGEK